MRYMRPDRRKRDFVLDLPSKCLAFTPTYGGNVSWIYPYITLGYPQAGCLAFTPTREGGRLSCLLAQLVGAMGAG